LRKKDKLYKNKQEFWII